MKTEWSKWRSQLFADVVDEAARIYDASRRWPKLAARTGFPPIRREGEPMTDTTSKLIKGIGDAIVETVKECPLGAPAGPLYAALMGIGFTLEQFYGIMDGLVAAGRIRKSGHLYFIKEAK